MGVDALRRSRTALLTSYRRNGQPVATPVSISLAGGRAYFVTAVDSGKARRVAHDPRVLLAPCTVGGERLGADISGRARRLEGGARRARPMLLRPTGPLFWSWLLYRLRGKTMALYEVEFDGPGEPGAENGVEPRSE
jgi:PPOX class probable F420-dependent enzyme